MGKRMIVLLDNVRSAHNVGSIFRSADGAGVEKIYLGGYTPTPIDRFGRKQSEISKTSLGASEAVKWEQVSEEVAPALLARLQADGYQVVAVEQAPNSVSLYDFTPPGKVCYVFGNEIEGVRQAILKVANKTVEIPMKGEKESLNVSVTAGIALFHRG